MARQRFGEYLIQHNILNKEAVSSILDEQRVLQDEFGQLAVRRGLMDETELVGHLSSFLGIPLFDAGAVKPDPELTGKVPKKLALKLGLFPAGFGAGGELVCACAGPINIAALQSVGRLVNRTVSLQLVSRRSLRKMQTELYSRQYDTSIKISAVASASDDEVHLISELLEKLLLRAINLDASDIHVEPVFNDLIIRFRVDGMLMVAETLPINLAGKLLTRIKVLSRLNIAEKRMPQDGAFFFKPERLDVDIEGTNIRTSILPVVHGEKAVMRILPPHDSAIDLETIGMQADTLDLFRQIVTTPYGIVLVTGPTGSGKSTTLYSVLRMLRSDTINLTTLEDPVEVKMGGGINQTQIDPGPKITFAGALRAILRQDPDVIMVGEIRDGETVRVALQAAITGHLVLSTLHTNDAPSAFTRLMDMGAEPFLVANSIRGVLAQRLVRRVCPKCAKEEPITQSELSMLGLPENEALMVNRGQGCEGCSFKGYRGRSGLYELLAVDDELQKMVAAQETTDRIRDYAMTELGFRTLRDEGIIKIRQGLTTPEEVMRVTMG
ncbi:type II/IV secretion system protein [Desulfobulbus rhabdoformis]|jgi:type IV pilus assembly protein PilB|uniref:GspE/PulE family protein n=1 Tax=Desulfobulbus rhabdoformis TaxID=34032 RepID=UPI00196259DD|nr:GspE/PulE family protein [Desulfobulbus rhabdoformis]MBM9612851.1 type II/IV secretion system protein [Desulfobulbus rhabdoformis]